MLQVFPFSSVLRLVQTNLFLVMSRKITDMLSFTSQGSFNKGMLFNKVNHLNNLFVQISLRTYFLFLLSGSHLATLRGFSWLCTLLLVELGEPYGTPGIEPGFGCMLGKHHTARTFYFQIHRALCRTRHLPHFRNDLISNNMLKHESPWGDNKAILSPTSQCLFSGFSDLWPSNTFK